MTCPLCERVQNTQYPYLVHEFENSFLYLGEHQFYRGYCVLVSKTHYREMTDIPDPQRTQLFQEMMISHQIIQRTFHPKKMNMCSLGNVVDHIHWHFFPRYDDDADFKNPPWLQMHQFESAKVSPMERDKLIEHLKTQFSYQ
jgi:diadenosine tetraphosphate (Ap4A) HIT family hydrolase